jgi:hypothetical protein
VKHKHLFTLLDQTFTTVHVIYSDAPIRNSKQKVHAPPPRQPAPTWGAPPPQAEAVYAEYDTSNGQTYVYKVPKSWGVREGDMALAIVQHRGIVVVTVVRVDLEPDIDPDADFEYRWLVQKVDTREYEDLNEREKSFNESMLQVERVKQRESLVNSFRESLPAGSEALRLFEQTTKQVTIEQPAPPPPATPPPAAPARSPFPGDPEVAPWEPRAGGNGPDDDHTKDGTFPTFPSGGTVR